MRRSAESKTAGAVAGAVALVTVSLAAFLGKAFHVDDPIFLWSARQILAEPTDFYGLQVNWLGHLAPMATATMNPPLVSYYLALAMALGAGSEATLHAALLVFPVAVVLGTASLARRLGADPGIAAVAAALTPAFLMAGSSVMSDMMMLAFWVWAVDRWIRGVRERRSGSLLAAGLLTAAAALSKYYGIALVPLLLGHGVAARRGGAPVPTAAAIGALAAPVAALLLYELATRALYGGAHFSSAMAYAARARAFLAFAPTGSALTGLAFVGGCLASALCFAPLLWSWRAIAAALALGTGAALLLAARPDLGGTSFRVPGGAGWPLLAHFALLATTGASVLALALADLRRHRDAEALLLALWVAGTFAFAAFLNWSNNGRANLPMAPAVGLLIGRRLALRPATSRGAVAAASLASLALALGVTRADALLADSARQAARRIADEYAGRDRRLWFLGHWGFQYYLEERGGVPVDVKRSALAPGDVVVIPSNNANVFALPSDHLAQLAVIEVDGPQRLATMSAAVGAGFYSSGWGPLPWSFGAVPPERYGVFSVREPIHFPLGERLPFGIR